MRCCWGTGAEGRSHQRIQGPVELGALIRGTFICAPWLCFRPKLLCCQEIFYSYVGICHPSFGPLERSPGPHHQYSATFKHIQESGWDLRGAIFSRSGDLSGGLPEGRENFTILSRSGFVRRKARAFGTWNLSLTL